MITGDVLIQAHSAILGLTFYEGKMFPKEYKGDVFVALHGSWNRTKRSGYRLVWVDTSQSPPTTGVFAQGWLQGQSYWGRPVDVLVMKDGSLLISDDYNGAVYRVSYAK